MGSKLDNLQPFKPMGEVALASKPLCVKVAPEVDAILRSLPDRSGFIRDAIKEKLQREGLMQPDQDN